MRKNNLHKPITLSLYGDKITSDKFRSTISAFYGFIDEVVLQVSEKKKSIKWIVSAKQGSIVLTSEPELAEGVSEQVFNNIVKGLDIGLNDLEKVSERPKYFSDKALEHLQNLANIPEREGTNLNKINISINGDKHNLTRHTIANIDTILGIKTKALGSIEGKLKTITEKGSLKFVVYDSITNKAVNCYFTDELLDDVMKAFRKRIYVFGLINYSMRNEPKSINVEEFKTFPETTPSFDDVCGILGE